ncbi:hypothetical protein GRJ2_002046000 [Grus japonensis]|uniref:Uncharacterized protein n=1 Tax=Grus japonensis TaxID=30415 RepID=A0ABC9XGQ8_GRUJA
MPKALRAHSCLLRDSSFLTKGSPDPLVTEQGLIPGDFLWTPARLRLSGSWGAVCQRCSSQLPSEMALQNSLLRRNVVTSTFLVASGCFWLGQGGLLRMKDVDGVG